MGFVLTCFLFSDTVITNHIINNYNIAINFQLILESKIIN